jgi:MGT family glycosyltransferase
MAGRPIVAICVQGLGHVKALMAVVAELVAERDQEVVVMTRPDLRAEVEPAGARFVDLYAGRPIEDVDDSSIPVPSRYVTFAGVHGEGLAAEIADLSPSLILYETYSLIGPVVARALGLPYVNVVPNHALVPARAAAQLRGEARVSTSPECWAAVARLRELHGMADANPFSYVEAFSPHLNLYPEPAQFLADADRPALEPLAFFGTLSPRLVAPAEPLQRDRAGRRRILVSFGTIVWLYYAEQAFDALAALARESAELGDVDLIVSLGGHPAPAERLARLDFANVTVSERLDQWRELERADAFVTHHGINSTHEAIYQRVPMISYPLSGDQPLLAARCQELGLAVPLADEPRGEVAPGALARALGRLEDDRDGYAERLARAREWELRTIAGRGEALDRIIELSRASAL